MTDVRAFYERHPYPAPPGDLHDLEKLYRDPMRRRVMFHLLWPTRPYLASRRILVAGCGTSQAAAIALREPESKVFGIDISEISLSHTRKLQQRHALTNLHLQQLPIESVHELNENFDQIICTGVLHHLPDPDRGLKALLDVLKPSGAMQLMVYALYGRSGIYMLQNYCRLVGIRGSEKELRDLISTLQKLPQQHPLAAVMRSSKDFLHPDALADALLHPQDVAYSVPQLLDWMNRCSVRFGRWVDQAPYLPQCGTLATTPHAARLGRLPAHEQHAAIELWRGTMTKHHFTAHRADEPANPTWNPFDASDHASGRRQRWQHLIPIRIPWTITVRERLPRGAVAVLINRSHTFPDLILPVDREQEELLSAINGERNLAEILGQVATGISEKRALTFFRRLWNYDQVVFDASQTSVSEPVA